jgi:hypothetical protein
MKQFVRHMCILFCGTFSLGAAQKQIIFANLCPIDIRLEAREISPVPIDYFQIIPPYQAYCLGLTKHTVGVRFVVGTLKTLMIPIVYLAYPRLNIAFNTSNSLIFTDVGSKQVKLFQLRDAEKQIEKVKK